MIKQLLLIGLGGASGSILRYLCQKLIANIPTRIFPLGTFMVNIIGCLLIGVFYGLVDKYTTFNQYWALLLITGFCGGFTTFSSFSYESMTLLHEGQFLYFGLYVGLSVLLGILAVILGMLLIR